MKFVLLAMMLMVASLPAKADVATETCTRYAEFSRVVMRARQANAPVEQVWPAATDSVMTNIVILAYKKPVWYTTGAKAAAVQDFGSEMFLLCIGAQK